MQSYFLIYVIKVDGLISNPILLIFTIQTIGFICWLEYHLHSFAFDLSFG